MLKEKVFIMEILTFLFEGKEVKQLLIIEKKKDFNIVHSFL